MALVTAVSVVFDVHRSCSRYIVADAGGPLKSDPWFFNPVPTPLTQTPTANRDLNPNSQPNPIVNHSRNLNPDLKI